MSGGSDRELARLLAGAIARPAGARRAWLEGETSDPDLVERVMSRLDREAAESFLDEPVALPDDLVGPIVSDPAGRETGADAGDSELGRFGPYTIESLLGEGGMGRVYLARQSEPVKRQVAIKVMRRGFYLDSDRARFTAERQALARLSHPNVAQMYEAGATEDGRPYFVMEWVDGQPITAFCNDRALGIAERLRLFVDTCRGVEHAHQKQVLHRDLKPSNVLVTEASGAPVPKVIDFGIAKGLDQPLTGDLDETGGLVLGTPGYTAPEMLERGAAEGHVHTDAADTRSDVYALGILLYELLVAGRPFDAPGASLPEVFDRIVRGEPCSPSRSLGDLQDDRRREAARCRGTSPLALRQQVRGDLDAIVLQAIAKAPGERYGSVAELAADVERHLQNQPVLACRPSLLYRARKFARRHTVGVAAAVGALVLTAAYTYRLAEERDRATTALSESVSLTDFVARLLEVADPDRPVTEPGTMREMLDLAAERILAMEEMEPLNKARLLHTVGGIYEDLLMLDRAEPLLAEAVSIREAELDAHHPDLIASLGLLGEVYRRLYRYEEAEALLLRRLSLARQAEPPDLEELATTWAALSPIWRAQGRDEEALEARRRAVEILDVEMEGADRMSLADALDDYGNYLVVSGRFEEAEPVLRRAATLFEDSLGEEHHRYGLVLAHLSMVEEHFGDWNTADAMRARFLATREKAFGVGHPRTLGARRRVADGWLRRGLYLEAAEELERVVALQEAATGPDHLALSNSLNNLGQALGHLGDFVGAEAALARCLEVRLGIVAPDSPPALAAMRDLGWLVYRAGRLEEAESRLRPVLEHSERTLGRRHYHTATTLHTLGQVLAAQGRDEEARDTADTLHELGLLTWREGGSDLERAEALLTRALDIYTSRLPAEHPDTERLKTDLEELRSGAARPGSSRR